jgi:hypothetical protein
MARDQAGIFILIFYSFAFAAIAIFTAIPAESPAGGKNRAFFMIKQA